MLKSITLSFLCFGLFIACASHANPTLLMQELEEFSTYESNINAEIESINSDMVAIIEEHKKSDDLAAYNKNVEAANARLSNIVSTAKKRAASFTHPSIKEYANIAAKKLEVEAEMASDIYSQYIEGGEFNRKDNRKIRSKNLAKLRKLDKKESDIISNIKNELASPQ